MDRVQNTEFLSFAMYSFKKKETVKDYLRTQKNVIFKWFDKESVPLHICKELNFFL